MESIGPAELFIVLVVAVFVFGPSRLPKLARSLGQASHEFRKGLHGHANAEIDAVIRQDAEAASYGELLAAEGVTVVALDDEGRLVEHQPDGESIIIE